MRTLYEELNALVNWDYYNREDELRILDWNDNYKHQDFIKNFLKISGKELLVSHFFNAEYSSLGISLDSFQRATHTNSVFFIGSLLYEKLLFKDKINFVRDDGKDNEFYFIWFLTSLIHDFGYFAEKDKSKFPEITEEISSIKREHDLLNYRNNNEYLTQVYDEYQESIRKIIDYIPSYFKEAFEGKRSSKSDTSKIEHGIYAGLLLYDGLVKNRIERKEQQNGVEDSPPIGLYWEDDLDKFYAVASFSIAIHNMRRDGIIDNPNELKFSIDEEPYLFLFALADTIEPIKNFEKEIKNGDITVEYVLKNILIDITENIITLQNAPESKLDFSKIISQVCGLANWLDVEVCYDGKILAINIITKSKLLSGK